MRSKKRAGPDLGDTKTKILEAAFRRLAEDGYAALSVREIGKDAGVNHALINYHFRSKDQLVIAVLDAANQRLLERQTKMYGGPGGFAAKWAEARRFYQDDLASGFVRVQAELWAASFSNAGLRKKFLPRLLAWKKVVLGGVRDALAAPTELGTASGDLAAALLGDAAGTADATTQAAGEDAADWQWSLSDAVPPGSVAAVALIEHLWAPPLLSAIQRAGGTPLEESWLAADDIDVLEQLVAAHKA